MIKIQINIILKKIIDFFKKCYKRIWKVKMCTYINANNKNLRTTLNGLSSSPGTCIFIDICNSTKIKYKYTHTKWMLLLLNTFSILQSAIHINRNHVIKFIGDEIMIYIPDSDLPILKETHSSIYEQLKCFIKTGFNNIIDDVSLKTKAAIHYCDDVYNITFHNGFNDYYGIGIDLTARYMKKDIQDKIVISKDYYDKIYNQSHTTLSQCKGPFIECFKGVPNYSEFYIDN